MSITYGELTQNMYELAKSIHPEWAVSQEVIEAKESFIQTISIILANNLIIQEYGELKVEKGYQLSANMLVEKQTLFATYHAIDISFKEWIVDSILSNILEENEYVMYALLFHEYKKFWNTGVVEKINELSLLTNYDADTFTHQLSQRMLKNEDFHEVCKSLLSDIGIEVDDESTISKSDDVMVQLVHQFNQKLLTFISKDNFFFMSHQASTTIN